MSKHTKGPWEVRKWDGVMWPEARYSVGPQDEHIAEAVAISPKYPSERIEADFTLIAAAPELLEALEGVTQCVFAGVGAGAPRFEDAMFEAQRVMAKAKGKSDGR